MRIFIILFLFLSTSFNVKAQTDFVEVKGLPTKEVFDLLIDKKGFLWIGHNLGISRYDGVNFTHFSNPLQSSLSLTDLIEDPYGRIWCHNFNGQVFYIEHERMNLLEDYKYRDEPEFPRMGLLKNELLITSVKGLFVVNVKTMTSRYVKLNRAKGVYSNSLAVLKDRAILKLHHDFYEYTQQFGIKSISLKNFLIKDESKIGYTLHNEANNDTVYLKKNPIGTLDKLVYKTGAIAIVASQEIGEFINTLSFDKGQVWLNTRTISKTEDGKSTLHKLNISDIVTDREGNLWASSLNKGLLVQYRTLGWRKSTYFGPESTVRSIDVADSILVISNKKGPVVFKDITTGKINWQFHVPHGYGEVEFVKKIDVNHFLISLSATTFLVDTRLKKEIQSIGGSARDADTAGPFILIASPTVAAVTTGIYQKNRQQLIDRFLTAYPVFRKEINDSNTLAFAKRSKAIRFDPTTSEILVALKNELWSFGSSGQRQVFLNNSPVNVTGIERYKGDIYIATWHGLLLKRKFNIEELKVWDESSIPTIIKMFKSGNHLWLVEKDVLEVYDLDKNKIIQSHDLTQIGGLTIYDIEEFNGEAYVITDEGVFVLSLKGHTPQTFKSYLTSIYINDHDTLTASNNFDLPHNKNSIQFNLSIPWFNPSTKTYFHYRLKGEDVNSSWYTTNESERTIRFASLMPGQYTFESYAMIGGIAEKKPLVIHFTIKKPWWKQWWFVSLVVIALGGGLYVLYQYRLQQLLRVEKIRRKISSDLHDEIGSTLSSINIYSELAKIEKDNNEYLGLIQNNVREVITKLDDLVWSINPLNDTFDQLINRMQLFAAPLLASSNIHSTFEYEPGISKLNLGVEAKQNFYLIFKESVNNVAKHSGATECFIGIQYRSAYVFMTIRDNGKGFDEAVLNKGRNGLKNMEERAEQVGGKLKVSTLPGKGTVVSLRMPVA